MIKFNDIWLHWKIIAYVFLSDRKKFKISYLVDNTYMFQNPMVSYNGLLYRKIRFSSTATTSYTILMKILDKKHITSYYNFITLNFEIIPKNHVFWSNLYRQIPKFCQNSWSIMTQKSWKNCSEKKIFLKFWKYDICAFWTYFDG